MRIKIDDLNRIYSGDKRVFSDLNVNIEPGFFCFSVFRNIENVIFACMQSPLQGHSFEKIFFDNDTVAKGDKTICFFEEDPLGETQKMGFQQMTEKREAAIRPDLKHTPVYHIDNLPEKQHRSNSKYELFH